MEQKLWIQITITVVIAVVSVTAIHITPVFKEIPEEVELKAYTYKYKKRVGIFDFGTIMSLDVDTECTCRCNGGEGGGGGGPVAEENQFFDTRKRSLELSNEEAFDRVMNHMKKHPKQLLSNFEGFIGGLVDRGIECGCDCDGGGGGGGGGGGDVVVNDDYTYDT